MNERLAKTRAGRVILHAICLVRNPHHAQWHWRGILRELQPAVPLHPAHAHSGMPPAA